MTELTALLDEFTEGVGLAPGLVLDAGDAPDAVTAAELARPPYDRLAELVAATAERWDAPRHVGAALWWKAFCYWTTLPVAVGWVLDRRIPLMTADRTVVRPVPDLPGMVTGVRELRFAAAPDDAALGAIVRATLVGDLHAPLVEALHALTRIGRRGLWGSLAECLADPILSHARHLTPDPAAAAAALLRAAGRPIADLVDPPQPADRAVRRRTCCLWVTLPDREACPSCCLLVSRAAAGAPDRPASEAPEGSSSR